MLKHFPILKILFHPEATLSSSLINVIPPHEDSIHNEIQVFNYNDREVRTVQKDGELWSVLKDVCAILGIGNNRMASDRLDADEKGVSQIDTLGGKQEMTVINESGLYNVILRSDKPEAKPFRKWVTSEVLPAIRKNGGYIAGTKP